MNHTILAYLKGVEGALQTIAAYPCVHLGRLQISCKEKRLHILVKLNGGEL